MKISGQFTVKASQEKVWETLNDVHALGTMIPGAKGLKEVGPNQYTATMDIGIGPIRTSFSGKVSITEIAEPDSYTLNVDGNSRHGWMRGTGKIELETVTSDSTLIRADGNVHVGGMIARVGQRMIPGVAKQMMATFFQNVEKHARAKR